MYSINFELMKSDMGASIEFKDVQGNTTPDLKSVKIITLNDGIGNTYTLGAEKDGLRLKYKPSDQEEVEYKVEGLAAALGSLFNVKSDSSGERTVLQEKVTEKPIVEAILYATDSGNNRISDTVLAHTFARRDDIFPHVNSKLDTKADKAELNKKADAGNVYTKKDIDDKLGTKADANNVYTKEDIDDKLRTKADANNVYTKREAKEEFFPIAEHRVLAREILQKRADNGEPILIKTLGEFLDEEDAWCGSERSQTAKDFLAEKGEFTKTDGSNIRIPDFTNKILGATEDIEGGKKKSILVEQLGEFLDKTNDDDKAYDGKIAKDFLGEKGMQGPKGTDGAQGPAGQNGKSPSASDVAKELITNKVTELGQAILNIKRDNEEQPALETDLANNSNFQESVAGNKGLRDAVTTTLKGDETFHSIVKRDLSQNGESLSVDDIVTRLLSDKNKALINTIGNDKEVAAKILGATDTDGRKSILVEKLARFLGANDQVYDSDKKTAKEFLNSIGLASSIDTSDPNFYGAVREIISRPYFEIPDDPNAPLSLEW